MKKRFLLLWLLLGCLLHAQDKKVWMWENPTPQGKDIFAIWGTARNDIFAVGDKGAILYFDGNRWVEMVSPVSEDRLTSVWGNASDDVFAVGGFANSNNGQTGNAIIHFDGNEWTSMEVPINRRLFGVWSIASDDAYAVGSEVILHFDGETWEVVKELDDITLVCVWGNASDNVYVGGVNGLLLHFDGNEWQTIQTPFNRKIVEIHGVEGVAGGDIYLITSDSLFLYDGNNFTQLANVSTDGGQSLTGLWVHSPQNIIMSQGAADGILRYNGSEVEFIETSKIDELYDVWGDVNGDTFIVGQRGRILLFDTLSLIAMDNRVNFDTLTSVWASSVDDIFASAIGGKILQYDGNEWREKNSNINQVHSVWGFAPDDVFAVGAGAIAHYNGSDWSQMNCPTPFTLHGVWGSAPDDVFAVGEHEIILHFDGTKWSIMSGPSNINRKLSAVWGTASDNVFAVGAGILHYDGTEWKPLEIPFSGGHSIWGTSENDIFVGGGNGQIFHFDGNEWTEMETPVGTNATINSVSGTSSSNVFAVGRESSLLHFDGTEWVRTKFHSDIIFGGVFAEIEEKIIAVGTKGTILRFINPALEAPDNLRVANVETEQLNLNWRDNSMGEQGFVIERKSEGREEFQEVGSVGSNTTDFLNDELVPFTKYFYRLKSFTEDGESRYSNIRSVITAVGEMMCVDSLSAKINKDQQSATLSLKLLLNNIDNSFIPQQDNLRLTISDSERNSYEILALGINFSKKGKTPGVFSVKSKAKKISGTINANIDGSSRSILQIKSSLVPIKFFQKRDEANITVQLQWGAFNQTLQLVAERKGDNFSFKRSKNTQTTTDLHFDSIKASVNLNKDNSDTIQVNLGFPGGGENYNPQVDTLNLSIGGFTLEVAPGQLLQKGDIAKGNIVLDDGGKVTVLVDLNKHILRLKASGVNLRDALEDTVIAGLQLGDFSLNRVITLQRKEQGTKLQFSYK